MEEKKIVVSEQGSGIMEPSYAVEHSYPIARPLVGTILGILVFAAAIVAADASHMRLPGHIVVFWFPALMAGRALSGYRGSGLLISALGGGLVNAWLPVANVDVPGFMLAAVVAEGLMLLLKQNPSVLAGIFLGIAVSLGKLLPKLAVILAGSSTPNHNRMSLPFMLSSYVLFGALAGGIYVGGLLLARKAGPRVFSGKDRDNSGAALFGLLIVVAVAGVMAALYG